MNNLKTEIKALINASQYEQAAQLAADKLNITLKLEFLKNDKHFEDDKDFRDIYKCTLKRGNREYIFNFGQSIAAGDTEPNLYDVLTCLQKYDVGTFEDFCGEFGYNRASEKTYKAVLKEFKALERLFTNEELEILQNIQ